MDTEDVDKVIESIKRIYELEEQKLKNYKKLEVAFKAKQLGINMSDGKFSLIPDHDKNFKRINEDIIVGITDTKTQEKFYFNEPVFNYKSISINNPNPKLDSRYNFLSPSTQTVAEKFLLKKREEKKQKESNE